MRKPTAALTLGAAIVLTGCGGPATVDTIDPDAPRAEKDEVFQTYIRDNYAETYGFTDDELSEVPRAALLFCSQLDSGQSPADATESLGLMRAPKEERHVILDIVYQDTKVYCPQHTDAAEWMNGGAK